MVWWGRRGKSRIVRSRQCLAGEADKASRVVAGQGFGMRKMATPMELLTIVAVVLTAGNLYLLNEMRGRVEELERKHAQTDKRTEGNATLLHLVTTSLVTFIDKARRDGFYQGVDDDLLPELYQTVMRLGPKSQEKWFGGQGLPKQDKE